MRTGNSLFWIQCGAILGGLAVIFGAFAAHGLGDYLLTKYGSLTKEVLGQQIPAANKYLADFKTAAEYQMYHALALVALGLLPEGVSRRGRKLAGWSFLLGIFLFSGSLYLLVLTGQTWLGMITPIGGTLFIVGWGAMFYAALCADRHRLT